MNKKKCDCGDRVGDACNLCYKLPKIEMGGEVKQTLVDMVEWVDSSLERDEVERGEKYVAALMSSAGYVVYEDEDVVTLARDIRWDEPNCRDTITIPKCCIKSRSKLLAE